MALSKYCIIKEAGIDLWVNEINAGFFDDGRRRGGIRESLDKSTRRQLQTEFHKFINQSELKIHSENYFVIVETSGSSRGPAGDD